MNDGNVRAPALVCVLAVCVLLRTWARIQVERLWCHAVCRPHSSSNDVAGVLVRSWSTSGHHVFVKSSNFGQYEGSMTGQQLGFVRNLALFVSLVSHVSVAHRTMCIHPVVFHPLSPSKACPRTRQVSVSINVPIIVDAFLQHYIQGCTCSPGNVNVFQWNRE